MRAFELNHDQKIAATTLAGPLLVTAGAGSGKTRVLTERTANAVRGGATAGWEPVDIERVLAITYTDKAAGELAERVRATLRGSGLQEQARRVDASWISTIHGMCARIVRAEALEAGIDPSFRVLETVEAGQLRQQALENAVGRVLGERGVSRLLGLYEFSAVAATVFRISEDLSNGDVDVDAITVAPSEDIRRLVQEAIDFFGKKSAFFESCGLNTKAVSDHGNACTFTFHSLGELLLSGLGEYELAEAVWRTLAGHDIPRTSAGVTDEVAAIRQTRDELCIRLAAAITVPLAQALVSLVGAYKREFETLKHQAGGLDFSDLQTEARRLLRRPDILERWRTKFALVMVDEFQDTDSLQLEVVEALAGENLCTVGDERQSIYRFRGADVDVYRLHNESMVVRGATPTTLSINYRSHPDLLAFVNRLFGDPLLFGEHLVVLGHGRTEPQVPALPAHAPRVEILLSPLAGNSGADEARCDIAREMAERIRALSTKGAIALGEIVILIPAYTHAHVYAEALRDRGMDAIVVGGSRFFEQREVGALRAALRVVVNRRDEIAVGEVLGSDLCGLSDDGLLELRMCSEGERSGLWESLLGAPLGVDDRARASALIRAVDRATESLGRVSLAETILQFVEDCGLDLRLLSGGLVGSQAYASVLKFVRLASAFESTQNSGPASFLAHLDAKEQFGDREVPATVAGGADEAAVRIMSIHASKGLEFPVVFVPELGTRGRGDYGPVRWRKGGEWALSMALPSVWTSDGKSRLGRPPVFSQLQEQESQAEKDERKRLLYVACTRAQDLLVLSGAQGTKPSEASTMLNWLITVLGISVEPSAERELDVGGASVRVSILPYAQPRVPAGPAAPETQGSREGNGEWYQLLEGGSPLAAETTETPRRLSYSGVHTYLECQLRFKAEKILGLGRSVEAAGPALRRGSALHTLLQIAGEDGVADDDAFKMVKRYYRLEDGDAERVRRAFHAYRSSSVADEVRRAGPVRREAPFAIWVGEPGGGFILDGTIDIYARRGDSALIVDYKTGETLHTAEELLQRYDLQARCYALAAIRDGAQVAEAVFVRPEVLVDGEPQAVRFRLTAADADEFTRMLTGVHDSMGASAWEHRAQWSDGACGDCPILPQMCALKMAHRYVRSEKQRP